MVKKKTHDDFVKEVRDLVGNEYMVLSEYISARNKISIKHNSKCNHIYNVIPNEFLRGSRCPKCNKGVKKTHIEFLNEVYELVNGEYVVLGKYVTATTKIKMKHILCDHEYDVLPNNFLKGNRCPNCHIKNKRKTHEEYVREIENLVGDIYSFLTEYVHIQFPIDTMHKKCGYTWKVRPNDLLTWLKKGVEVCPFCNHEIKLTSEKFKEIVEELVGNEYEVLGECKNSHTKVEMKHDICGNIYEVRPTDFINDGNRCPKCRLASKGETRILEVLSHLDLDHIYQYCFEDCKYDRKLKFDFGVFNQQNKLLYVIEFDGKQHFEPVDFAGKGKEWAEEQFKETQLRDQIKNQYCKENRIQLIRIPYWKYTEIESILYKLIHNEQIGVDETSFLVQ